MWSTGEGNGKLQYSCLENPMNSRKRQNDRIPKEELPRSLGAQYVTGDQWRNNFRKKEGMEPKQKQYPVADVTVDRSKIRCCKEQYCIETCNVRSMDGGCVTLYRRQGSRPSPNRNHGKEMQKKQHGCLGRPYKQLRKEEKRKAREKRKDTPI